MFLIVKSSSTIEIKFVRCEIETFKLKIVASNIYEYDTLVSEVA